MKKLIVFTLITLTGCASTTKPFKNGSTKLNTKAPIEAKASAVPDTGVAITFNSKQTLNDQLLRLRLENSEDATLLKNDHEQLVHCQKDLANPLLDGKGKIPTIPEVDAAMDSGKMKTTLGVSEHEPPIAVSEELVQDRIDRESKYSAALKASINVLQTHLNNCLVKMGIARTKHGLKPTWYSADLNKGYEQETNINIGFSNAAKDLPRTVPDFTKSMPLTPPF
ncbi:MAG: hypothetical protein ABIQ95_17255 [Bdellovibrionia bacterium]